MFRCCFYRVTYDERQNNSIEEALQSCEWEIDLMTDSFRAGHGLCAYIETGPVLIATVIRLRIFNDRHTSAKTA